MTAVTTPDQRLEQDRTFPLPRTEPIAIHQILNLFEKGSPELLALMAEDLDFRIDHYRDELDVSWQSARNLAEMTSVLQRLAQGVFTKGTRIAGLSSVALGEGWFLTRFHQVFFYEVRQCDCESVTLILSHEKDGRLDYFRETVTNVVDLGEREVEA
ncbi:hypothetical protein [Labrenzia sp. OB1]|uniref:hypothetical protein n=1 Tax=Labrenzia sp. OB1 TaxID=1561204 RepID=UPI000837AC65|nr:hypothetical protein [Labrenzia sp. OB1]